MSFRFDEMSCAYPSYNPQILDIRGNMVPIPCGKCFCCRLDWQKRTMDRLFCAWHSHDLSAFVTFTYDDEHLRFNDGFVSPTLSKTDLHKYLDKIKHQIKIPFEYYVCGEYGDKFNRPHYHALFFGLDYQLHKKFFEDSWKLGTVKVLPCQPNSFRYVTKYVTKSIGSNDFEFFDYGLEPPFRKMSRGLGISVYLNYLDDIENKGYFVFKGRRITVNRYYFNKLLHYTPDLLVINEFNLNDRDREDSYLANGFKLPLVSYRLMKIDNLEKSLSSKQLREISTKY